MHSSSDDDELDADMNNSVLYDVLVYNEWNVVRDAAEPGQEQQQQQELQQGLVQRLWPFKSDPFSTSNGRMAEMRRLAIRWQLAVASDASLVALAQDGDILEILARSGGSGGPSYLSVSRSELPHDPVPELRRLAWSQDSQFLAVTSSNGRVLVYDSRSGGDLAFAVLSNNLPDWDSPPDPSSSYCLVRFVMEPQGTSAWHSRLFLADNSGRVNVFLCAPTGYQELASSSALCQVYPQGVLDVALLPDSSLLYACGQASGRSARGITCWRMTEEQEDQVEPGPFLELVDLQGYSSKPRGLWPPWPGGGSPDSDPAYLLAASDEHRLLASAHLVSGDICVFSLPGLNLLRVVPLADQPCFDDVNPHCLKKDAKSIFLKHPLAFQPTTLRWWDKSCLVVARLSGGITIIPVGCRKDDLPGDNLLGDSAEFFCPCCSLSQCFEFGFFAMEVDGDRRYREDPRSEGRRATLYESAMDMLDSITGGRGGAEEDEKGEDREETVVYRLVYFQSTSPEELFQKKIDDEEYGEAVVMARHFGLDCDRVFVRQWRSSDLSPVAAQDYLSKVEDLSTLLKECAATVPPNPDSCRSLLSFGLARVQAEFDRGRTDPALETAQGCLAEFLDRLDLYLGVVDCEEDFDPEEYNSFRTLTLRETATKLARQGRSHRLKRLLMVAEQEELTGRASEVLSSLPEPLDPMPDLAEIMTRPAVARATTAAWFRERAARTVGMCGQSDYALALLHLAANLELDGGGGGRRAADPVFYHHLATYDALVFEKKDLAADFDKIQATGDKKLLEMLLAKPRPNLTKVFKTLGLPFLDRVEQCASGSSVRLFREFVVEVASRDFIAASDLLRVVAENLDETWFTPADLRAMGMEVVWNSSPNSDVQGLASFLAYLQDYCRPEEEGKGAAEYTSLLEAVRTLGFVSRYDRSATIAGIKEAQGVGSADRARTVISRMLSGAKDKMKLRDQRSEVLHDILTVAKSCQDLELKDAFCLYCEALLEAGDESAIDLAREVTSARQGTRRDSLGSLGSNSAVSKVRKVMANFGVALPSPADLSRLAAAAAAAYVDAARDCADPGLALAESCLKIAPPGTGDEEFGRVGNLVSALMTLSGNFDFVSPMRPAKLRNARSASEVGNLLHSNLSLPRPFGNTHKIALDKFSSLIGKALGLEADETRAQVLSAVARVALESQDRETCLSLCGDLMEGKLDAGWEICRDAAEECYQKGDSGDEPRRRRLLAFSAAHCDRGLEAAAGRLSTKEFHPRDVVPGFTFGENCLEGWDGAAQVRKLQDIFGNPDAYAEGGRARGGLCGQHVFEQDPALAAAATTVEYKDVINDSNEEVESLDLLRLSLAAAAWAAAAEFGSAAAAAFSVRQLCQLDLTLGGAASKALRDKCRSNDASAASPEKATVEKPTKNSDVENDDDDEEDIKQETSHEIHDDQDNDDGEEVAVVEVPPVVRVLAALTDQGVPLGMRTLASCLHRLRREEQDS